MKYTRVAPHNSRAWRSALLALLVFAGSALSTLLQATEQTYDLVLAGGRVIDPESGLNAVRNVGVTGGAITAKNSRGCLHRQTECTMFWSTVCR